MGYIIIKKKNNKKMSKIKITENKLKQIVNESVKKVLKEGTSRCPDKYFGGYFFESLGRDINGNPIYCSEHLPLEAKKCLVGENHQNMVCVVRQIIGKYVMY